MIVVRGFARLTLVGMGCVAAMTCGRDEIDCVPPPCPLPIAIQISVVSKAGGPVPGVLVELLGTRSGTAPCNVESAVSQCYVPGLNGTYELRVSAPGFRTQDLSIVVPGADGGRCGCSTVETQRVAAVLEPS
jgi:hypothetical protein